MSNTLDIYKAYYDASWANPPSSAIEASETYLSDDFQSLDKDGNVEMDKKTYIGSGLPLFAAFKDLKFVLNDIREEGDSVIVSGHFQGTHSGDLDMSMMGLGVIPASGKMIVWPESTNKFKVEGDKIVSIQAVGDAAGIASFLETLGVTLPSA